MGGARFQPYAAPTTAADGIFPDELHAGGLQRPYQLYERIHGPADDALAGFHALNGWHGQLGGVGERALVQTEERARGTELGGGDHVNPITIDGLSIKRVS